MAADSAVGVNSIQPESTISIGRYALTDTTAVDSTDSAEYIYHRVGEGTNRILGIPRDTVEGYTAATGLVSQPGHYLIDLLRGEDPLPGSHPLVQDALVHGADEVLGPIPVNITKY